MRKLNEKPSAAFTKALAAAGYGYGYETGSMTATFHRLPTKDANGELVWSDAPVDMVQIDAVITVNMAAEPPLSKEQLQDFLMLTSLDDAIDLRIKALKATDRPAAVALRRTFYGCTIKTYADLNSALTATLKTALKTALPTLDLTPSVLKAAWNRAASGV